MIGWLTALLLLGLAGIILRVARDRDGPLPGAVIMIGLAIPAVLIVAALTDAQLGRRYGDLRLSLKGFEANLDVVDFRVGGDRAKDDLIVPGAPGGLIIFSAGDRPGTLTAKVDYAASGERVSVVSTGRKDKLQFHGARALPDKTLVCLEACDRGGAWFRFDADTARFTPEGGGAPGEPMPSRRALGLPAIAPWTPAQAIHPLRDFLPAGPGERLSACRDKRCVGTGAGRHPALSFIYQRGGLAGGAWSILLLDPGAEIRLPDAASKPAAGEAPQVSLVDQPALSMAVWDVRYSDAPAPGTPHGRLQERRAFSVRAAERELKLALTSPAIQMIGACRTNARQELAEHLEFEVVGGALGFVLGQTPPHPQGGACQKFTRDDDIRLEDNPGRGERTAVLSLERVGFPWLMLWTAVLWAGLLIALQRPVWTDNRLHWALFMGLQTLLAFRVLFAFAGHAADLQLPGGEGVVGAAVLTYVLCPALFLLALKGRTAVSVIATAMFTVAVTGAVWLWTGAPPPVLLLGVVAVVAISAIQLWLPRRLRGGERVQSLKAAFDRRLYGDPSWWIGPAILLGTAAVRALLGLLSFKERFFGIALSAAYTPMLVLGFSLMVAVALREPRDRMIRGVLFAVLLLVTFVVLPVGLSDVGYAVVMAPVAFVAAVLVGRRPGGDEPAGPRLLGKAIWVAPAVGVVAVMAGLLVWGALSSPTPPDLARAAAAPGDEEALGILEASAHHNQNRLRLWALYKPEMVDASGSREAENLRLWADHLSDYTGTLDGRGYLASPNLSDTFRRVQLDDNLTAIHLMAPFGRVTAAALLALLAAVALAGASLTAPPDNGARPWFQIAGLMCLWILFGVTAYMVLANLQLTLFTGRNAYLLAAASESDLLEGLSLFLFAWFGLSLTVKGDA